MIIINPMNNHKHEVGAANPMLIASIVLGVLAAGLAGGFIWAYTNYVDQRDNTQAKVDVAVGEAKKEQIAEDEKQFIEREKEPFRQLIGPDDFGRVTFNYPKTWSVYVASSDQRGYEVYLHPTAVPTVTATQAYALRVNITQQSYDNTVNSYTALVRRGDLKSSPIEVNGFTGVRLDGKFSATKTGSEVVFKVRDKTLTVSSDIDSFRSDFDNIILKSLTFVP